MINRAHTHNGPDRARRHGPAAAIAGGSALALMAFAALATSAESASAAQNGKVTLCHATPPASAQNGWVQITVSTNAVTHAGHGRHADDIIPAFTYTQKGTRHSYPGKNLDTDFGGMTGQQVLAAGCSSSAPRPSGSAGTTHQPGNGSEHGSGHGKGAGKGSGHRNGSGEGSGNGGAHNPKVTLCHATPPATAKNGWVQITVSTNAVTHAGHGGHADDIIPAFSYTVKGTQYSYSGKNLDTDFDGMTGQQLLADGCVQTAPASSSAASSGAEPGNTSTSGSTGIAPSDAGSDASSSTTSGGVEGVDATRSGQADGAGTAGTNGTGTNDTSGTNAGGLGVDAAQTTAPADGSAVAPAGADASGLAVGDTGDHGTGGGAGMAAAVVGGSLAVLIGMGVLAMRRRRPDAGA